MRHQRGLIPKARRPFVFVLMGAAHTPPLQAGHSNSSNLGWNGRNIFPQNTETKAAKGQLDMLLSHARSLLRKFVQVLFRNAPRHAVVENLHQAGTVILVTAKAATDQGSTLPWFHFGLTEFPCRGISQQHAGGPARCRIRRALFEKRRSNFRGLPS